MAETNGTNVTQGKGRILVVDDEEHILALMPRALKDYQVVTESDSTNAVQTARKFKPDLVLADYKMPRMTGLEMMAKINGDGFPTIGCIFMTGNAGEIPNNPWQVIRKPFHLADLISVVNSYFESQRQRQSTAQYAKI